LLDELGINDFILDLKAKETLKSLGKDFDKGKCLGSKSGLSSKRPESPFGKPRDNEDVSPSDKV